MPPASPASALRTLLRWHGWLGDAVICVTPRLAWTFVGGRLADDLRMTSPQVMSADGGRYADVDIEFWIKGWNAPLTMNGVKETYSRRDGMRP
jgi:hypothetical protein